MKKSGSATLLLPMPSMLFRVSHLDLVERDDA
jgi:hypothetical protein